MGRRNSWDIEGTINRLASGSDAYGGPWLRGFSCSRIQALNRATDKVQQRGYLETRIPDIRGELFPSYLFPELISDIFDVWREGSTQERVNIFGTEAADLEGHVECATLTPQEFRVWCEFPASIYNQYNPEQKPLPHASAGSRKLLFDTSNLVEGLRAFLSVFEEFGRCKVYPLGVIVFSPREYRVINLPRPQQDKYVLERMDP